MQQLKYVDLFTDLAAAGGVRVAAGIPMIGFTETLREDGNDQLAASLRLSNPASALMQDGYVLRAVHANADGTDGTIVEWPIQTILDTGDKDRTEITCAGPRSWMQDVLLYDRSVTAGQTVFTKTDTVANVFAWLATFPNWPAWVTAGTIEPTDRITLNLAADNGLTALLKIPTAVDLVRPVANDACVMAFRRASDSSYVVDFLYTPAAGTAHLLENKNLTTQSRQRLRVGRVTEVAPVGANGLLIGEALFGIKYVAAGPTGQWEVGVSSFSGSETIVFADNQWAGLYLVDNTGATFLVLASAATFPVGKLYISNTTTPSGGVGHFAVDNSGTRADTLIYPNAAAPAKRIFASDSSGDKINWAYNPSFDYYNIVPACDGWNPGTGLTLTKSTSHVETGAYSLQVTSNSVGGALLGGQLGTIPGSYKAGQWQFGFVFYNTTGAGCTVSVSVNGTAVPFTDHGGVSTISATATGRNSQTGLFTLTGSTSFTFTVTFSLFQDTTIYLDRVWLFRVGVDDGDTTVLEDQATVRMTNAARVLRAGGGTPLTNYSLGIRDLTRNDPVAFPYDNLLPFQTCLYESLTFGTRQSLRIVEVVSDQTKPLSTTVQLVSPRRRLTDKLSA